MWRCYAGCFALPNRSRRRCTAAASRPFTQRLHGGTCPRCPPLATACGWGPRVPARVASAYDGGGRLHAVPGWCARALSSAPAGADSKPAAGKDAVGAAVKQPSLDVTEPSPWTLLRSLWPTEASHQARIAFAMAGLLAGKALTILAPLQLGRLVDALGAGAEALPLGLLAAYGLARLSTSGFNELRAALFATVSQASCRVLARRSFEHLHSLDAAYLHMSKPGTLSVIISRATRSLTQVLNMLLFNVLPIVVEFAMALAVMASLAGPSCACVAAGTVGAYVVFTTRFSQRRREIMRRANKAEEDASGVFFDSLANCEVVKYFQNEEREKDRYDAALLRFETEQVRVLHSLAQLNFGQQLITIGGFTAILALTASRVIAGTLPVGDVVAIHGILAQLMQPLGILGGVYRVTTQGFIDLGKLHGFLQRASSVPPPADGGVRFEFEGGRLEFQDVHHAYGEGSPVLAGASLVVPPGVKAALVGPSGSGKTTLLRLLYRFADPTEGRVLIDGQDVRHLDLGSFRRHLGIVPQDCALFNETVGFNIRYGRPGASDEEVQAAARLAQIHELVASLPQGYDTPVGERGLLLSGGERQRIGIARCLLRDPSIVLLDEATSALDVRTERHLAAAMEELMRGRTCLIVAHRLSTVQRCDLVAYLEGGSVLELGSHEELLARSGKYRRFWEGAPAEA
uniref:ATP-dependent transporter ycf16 n=1 Tax=Pyrodinium bahamense TaxID=73915 RepID=A0A7S0B6S5_9DINO|mmetsp:Transcript_5227/g.14443  ORF Transcript_5227/g.14443 Transcript_5227/m.14443 type:complete len:687 (+) Transcript_5227:62-2122(+)